jgi:hypothetical protein
MNDNLTSIIFVNMQAIPIGPASAEEAMREAEACVMQAAEQRRLKEQGEHGLLLRFARYSVERTQDDLHVEVKNTFSLMPVAPGEGYLDDESVFHQFKPLYVVAPTAMNITLMDSRQVGGQLWHFLFQRQDGVAAWLELNVETEVLITGSVQFPWPLTLSDMIHMMVQIKTEIQRKGLVPFFPERHKR